jgi:hypothetical protein
MRATLMPHHRRARSGITAGRVIVAECIGRTHREVERADSGQYSHKTVHVGLILFGKIAADVTLSLDASSSPTPAQ